MSRPRRGGQGPPPLVRLILRLLVPEEDREFYFGDLEESGRRPWLREIAGAASLRFARKPVSPYLPTTRYSASMISHSASDLRLGVRRLLRTPGATVAALTALSVGIGLAAGMFSLIDGALLPTLPFENGDRIVQVRGVGSRQPVEAYQYWSDRQTSFEGLGAVAERTVTLAIEGEGSESVSSAAMNVEGFRGLSVQPVFGRAFTEADQAPGAPAVVLVGYATWRDRLSSDPGVLDRVVRVNGSPAEIIGVMPEGFGFPWNQELWAPLRLDALRPEDFSESGFIIFGALREGVDAEAAAAELNELDRQRAGSAVAVEADPVTLRAFTDIMNPDGTSRLLAALMLGVAFLVLLVACANATNVLLALAAARSREVAVRVALGASRMRIAMQFWTEVSLLALAGAAGGALFAGVAMRLVRNTADGVGGMPFWIDLRVNLPVLAFIAGATALAATLAGILPAVHASRVDNQELLKDASRSTSSRRLGRTMGRLIGAEMAVSFVLLIAAGLFIRSAVNVQRYDFSFDPEDVYTSFLRLPDETYRTPADRAALAERLQETLAGIPGVSSATVATALPAVGGARRSVAVEGVHGSEETTLPITRYSAVTPEYFATFHAPLLKGRGFESRDRDGELSVAIVSASFESRYLPRGAVGQRVMLRSGQNQTDWLTIVGVAPDLSGPDGELPETVYRPLAQDPGTMLQLAVRSETSPTALAAPIREALAGLDPDIAQFLARSLEESIDLANSQYRWVGTLFLVAGGFALFLAAIGLYGVMAFWVAQRTREIGLRMAVGGGRDRIVALVLRQGMSRIGVGLAAGTLLALPVAWLLRGSLLDVAPFDPLVFGAVLATLLGAGWLGCMLPAMRATRVDPLRALTTE